jgi:hypothetical protein
VRRRRLADARDVVRAVSEPVPALTCVAGSCSAGCGAQGKARGSRSARGHRRGEGWHGVNSSEPLLMPRNHHIPGRVAVRGDRGFAVEMRQAAAGDDQPVVWTPPSPGYRGHPEPARSHACGTCKPRQGPEHCSGKPTVRGAKFPGGTGCPRSECRWPKGGRKTGQRGRLLRWPSRITGRIPGLVRGRESALTWAGEPLKQAASDCWNRRTS